MADILQFKRPHRPKQGMCQHGYHKWKADKGTVFDTDSGKLQTRLVCERCRKVKNALT